MERKMYKPRVEQERKWAQFKSPEMPSDEEFKNRWAKAHHGKVEGWGLGKRDWIVSNMAKTREYQMGLWQGRVDRLRGLEYAEERIDAPYNLGYYRGYTQYESDRRGWDVTMRRKFEEEYGNE